MKAAVLAFLTLTSARVFATDQVGFFFCEFERTQKGKWQDAVSFRDQSMYSLDDGEVQQQMYSVSTSKDGSTQFGYCLNATGTNTSAVQIDAKFSDGDRIDGFLATCEPYGLNVSTSATQSQILNPGEGMDLLESTFRHHVYLAMPRDFKGDVDANFQAHCEAERVTNRH
jgi:VCBS repeat-containing protein